MINIIIVGYGYWGPNLFRVCKNNKSVKVVGVLDVNKKKKSLIDENIPFYSNSQKIINEVKFDAVVIATPVADHYKTVKLFLNKGKHIFVEKPLAQTARECKELIKISERKKLTLMVGHLYLYNKNIEKLKELFNKKTFGNLLHIFCERMNLGRVQSDINVLWSLGPHDISILNYLIDEQPIKLRARGYSKLQKGIDDLVFIDFEYKNNISCFIKLSWHDPQKVRKLKFIFTKKMVIFDDVINSNKITITDISSSRVDDFMTTPSSFKEFQFKSKNISIDKINLKAKEPLFLEIDHFVECILKNKTPISDG